MTREHGHDFDGDRTDAMAANRGAKIAYCRDELRDGTDPHARTIACTLLRGRQAELSWLHHQHHDH